MLKPYNEFSFVKRLVKRPKMYFFDTGLAAALIGIDSVETLLKSYLKGRFFECFVMNELFNQLFKEVFDSFSQLEKMDGFDIKTEKTPNGIIITAVQKP